jgi:hypothetical protein
MPKITGLTIGPDQAVPVSMAELDASVSKFQEDDDGAPLSLALLTIQQKLAKKRGKTPAYKGINFGLVLQTHVPISDMRADIKALSAVTARGARNGAKKSVYTRVMYTIPGEFYKQWFRCRIVRKVRHGYLIQWQDGDKKDTFKLPQHIRLE